MYKHFSSLYDYHVWGLNSAQFVPSTRPKLLSPSFGSRHLQSFFLAQRTLTKWNSGPNTVYEYKLHHPVQKAKHEKPVANHFFEKSRVGLASCSCNRVWHQGAQAPAQAWVKKISLTARLGIYSWGQMLLSASIGSSSSTVWSLIRLISAITTCLIAMPLKLRASAFVKTTRPNNLCSTNWNSSVAHAQLCCSTFWPPALSCCMPDTSFIALSHIHALCINTSTIHFLLYRYLFLCIFLFSCLSPSEILRTLLILFLVIAFKPLINYTQRISIHAGYESGHKAQVMCLQNI